MLTDKFDTDRQIITDLLVRGPLQKKESTNFNFPKEPGPAKNWPRGFGI